MNDIIADILNKSSKALEKDKYADIKGGNDVELNSYVPYGIPSRQPLFDLMVGRDGIPIGKICEFYGGEGAGKSSHALHIMAQVQKMGGLAILIDTENSWDPDRAYECGIPNPESVLVGSTASIDGVFRIMEKNLDILEESGFEDPVVFVIDSITAVTAEYGLARGEGNRPGEEARAIKAGLKPIQYRLAKAKIPAIFINHLIANIGGMSFGAQSSSAGGKYLKYMAHLRLKFSKIGELAEGTKKDNVRLGHKVKVDLDKLKGSQQNKFYYESTLLNESGFDCVSQLLEAFVQLGKVKKISAVKYALVNNEATEAEGFNRKDWPHIVEREGGFDVLYKKFLQLAEDQKVITPWGKARYPY